MTCAQKLGHIQRYTPRTVGTLDLNMYVNDAYNRRQRKEKYNERGHRRDAEKNVLVEY